jgi:hypothetical protein
MKAKTKVKAGTTAQDNMQGANTNPLYTDRGLSGTNPIHSP